MTASHEMTLVGSTYIWCNLMRASHIYWYAGVVSPKFLQNFKMILRHILHIKNGSNFAHTLLSTIWSYAENPPEFFLKWIRLLCGFSYSKNIANFEAFCWGKNFSKNLLFLRSAWVCMYSGPENLKKSRPKKLVKSNKSISRNFF